MNEFISGVMGSGKSERLIEEIEKCKDAYLIIKPSTDTRDGAKIVTRAHERTHDAVLIDESNEEIKSLFWAGLTHYEVIFIDEVQFFSKEFVNKLSAYCDLYEIKIVASGLTYDFKGDFFPSSKVLFFEIGIKYEYHLSTCNNCGSDKANIDVLIDGNYNIIKGGNSVKIDDGSHNFKTLCDRCYMKLS